MTKQQLAKQQSLDKLENARIDNTIVLATFPGIISDFDQIKAYNDYVKTLTPAQEEDTSGQTEDKEALRIEYCVKIFKYGSAACSYFFKIGDMENYKKLHYTLPQLKKMRPELLIIVGERTVAVCTQFATQLVGYGITVLKLAEITTAGDAFAPKKDVAAENKVESKENTKEIDITLKRAAIVVKFQLCNSISAIFESHPIIYHTILDLTHDVQIGVRSHHAAKVVTGMVYIKVTNKDTGNPAEGVSLKAFGYEEVVLTDKDGMAEMELPIGAQEIRSVSFDFQPEKVNVTVTVDEHIVNIPLTPIVGV
jgi:hypothetical protein